MTYETLGIERIDGCGRIELQRPEKRNALSPTMAAEITTALSELEADPDVRVVSLRGSGSNFCSGGDLAPEGKSAAPRPGSPAATTLDIMNRVYGKTMLALHQFPKPIVALVEGVAAGAGANLAFCCDLVYATPTARFCEIFVRRGLSLDCGGSWILPRVIGMQKAKELALFGDWVSAEEAASIGLVNHVYTESEFEQATDERLTELARRPPIALGLIKQGLQRSFSMTMAECLEAEAVAQAACTATDDFAEGMRAFMEKREPEFKGR